MRFSNYKNIINLNFIEDFIRVKIKKEYFKYLNEKLFFNYKVLWNGIYLNMHS